MLKISLNGAGAIIPNLTKELEKEISMLADKVLLRVKDNTPIKTGNARRNWNSSKRKDGFTVENKVPYIERLEAGHSKQAPKGIIGPTLSQVKGK